MAKVTKVGEPVYTLTLTEREAKALWIVCQNVGGSADESARGIFSDLPDSLDAALINAGMPVPDGYEPGDYTVGTVTFRKDV